MCRGVKVATLTNECPCAVFFLFLPDTQIFHTSTTQNLNLWVSDCNRSAAEWMRNNATFVLEIKGLCCWRASHLHQSANRQAGKTALCTCVCQWGKKKTPDILFKTFKLQRPIISLYISSIVWRQQEVLLIRLLSPPQTSLLADICGESILSNRLTAGASSLTGAAANGCTDAETLHMAAAIAPLQTMRVGYLDVKPSGGEPLVLAVLMDRCKGITMEFVYNLQGKWCISNKAYWGSNYSVRHWKSFLLHKTTALTQSHRTYLVLKSFAWKQKNPWRVDASGPNFPSESTSGGFHPDV